MATTRTALPTLSTDDAERLARETQSYLMLVDTFRAEGIEPAWGADESPEPIPGCNMECESSVE